MGWGSLIGKAGGAFAGPLGSIVGGKAGAKTETEVRQSGRDIAEGIGELKDAAIPAAGSAWDVLSGEADRRFSRDEAQKNRDFQENMRDTAHQAEMRDLAAAGLNPMMAAQLGGAATPGGAVAHPVDKAGAAGNLLQKAMELAKFGASLRNLDSQTAVNDAQAQKTLVEAGDTTATQGGRLALQDAQVFLTHANVDQVRATIDKIGKEMNLTDAQIAEVQARALLTREQVNTQKNLTLATGKDVAIKEETRKQNEMKTFLDAQQVRYRKSSSGEWDVTVGKAIRDWINTLMPFKSGGW